MLSLDCGRSIAGVVGTGAWGAEEAIELAFEGGGEAFEAVHCSFSLVDRRIGEDELSIVGSGALFPIRNVDDADCNDIALGGASDNGAQIAKSQVRGYGKQSKNFTKHAGS